MKKLVLLLMLSGLYTANVVAMSEYVTIKEFRDTLEGLVKIAQVVPVIQSDITEINEVLGQAVEGLGLLAKRMAKIESKVAGLTSAAGVATATTAS